MSEFKQILLEILFIISLFYGIFLGVNISYFYFLIPVIVIALGWIYLRYCRTSAAKSRRLEIKRNWGVKKESRREYVSAGELFRCLKDCEADFIIDDTTWRDLNLDSIIKILDHTISFSGLQYLYYMLRKPLFSIKEIYQRNEQIERFRKNIDKSVEIQQKLDALGEEAVKGLCGYLSGQSKFEGRDTFLYKLQSNAIFTVPFILYFEPIFGIFTLIILLLANALMYNRIKNEIAKELYMFRYLGKLIACTEEIISLPAVNGILDKDSVMTSLKELNKLKAKLDKINLSSTFNDTITIKSEIEILLEFYNMIRMREPILFYEAVELLNANNEKLLFLYKELGRLDALISLAAYRESVKRYTVPAFIEDAGKAAIYCEDIYHPLLADPVPNSFRLHDYGALVTGSNASGKSTFLRTIGVNVLFSQTICTVLASKYEASLFKVLTSIGNLDSIEEGDSYFMAEAKSLKRIIDELERENHTLCILDEIFRGTNTVERISGAASILKYLSEKKCCVLAATHDLELTRIASADYRNYHFQEEVRENDIYFDYKLHEGACTSRNAILILKQLGYPETIYKEAMKMASGYK
ncbi:MAG: MutS-related protein [Bacillota bacterium]